MTLLPNSQPTKMTRKQTSLHHKSSNKKKKMITTQQNKFSYIGVVQV